MNGDDVKIYSVLREHDYRQPLPPNVGDRLQAIEDQIERLAQAFKALIAAHAELQAAYLGK